MVGWFGRGGCLKAPGPHGFQSVFYHSFWDALVDEVNGLV